MPGPSLVDLQDRSREPHSPAGGRFRLLRRPGGARGLLCVFVWMRTWLCLSRLSPSSESFREESTSRYTPEPCLQVTTVQIKVPDRELQHTTDQLTADMPCATLVIQRFAELVDSVPTLRNYHRGMMDRLVDATAEAIAGSLGRAA